MAKPDNEITSIRAAIKTKHFIPLVLIFFTLLFGRQPDTARVHAAVRPTVTPTMTRPTATPTMTRPPVEPTATPTPTDEPGEPGDHDVTMWHAPGWFHHHGADPATAHPMLVEAMEQYWTREIGSVWLSSHHENMFPDGAHAGFKNLVETDIGCPKYKPTDGDLCTNAYLLQVHALGTQAHALVAVHSWKAAVLVCETAEIDEDTCGVVLTGGWHDYGQLHAPYKKYSCKGPDSLAVPVNREFNAPYTALGTEHLSSGYNRILWNSHETVVMNQYFLAQRGYVPNQGMTIVWAEMDAWDMVPGSTPDCANPTTYTDSSRPSDNGTLYQVYDMRYVLPTERPFSGYTDRHGVIQPNDACNEQGLDCVPLYISENVPQGRLRLNRNVGPGYAPFLEFDDGTTLLPAPFSIVKHSY